MSIIKPYTFQGGTKARANEVNENFDRLYEQVNANITDIANMETEITNLGLDKADVAGSSLQRFAVADAIGDYDAVNLQTLRYLIWNSRGVIRGYVISKDSNNRIRVTWGVCYDSNETVVLPLRSSLAKTNDGQIANATYYVYSIGNDNGTTIDILITPSASSPNLPEGYTKYRGIGYFKTNNDNQISEVHSYSVDALDEVTTNWYNNNNFNIGLNATTSLSSIIPNDNNNYLVFIGANIAGVNSSSCVTATSDIATGGMDIAYMGYDANRSDSGRGTIVIPVGVGRWVRITTWGSFESAGAYIRGYMRMNGR